MEVTNEQLHQAVEEFKQNTAGKHLPWLTPKEYEILYNLLATSESMRSEIVTLRARVSRQNKEIKSIKKQLRALNK